MQPAKSHTSTSVTYRFSRARRVVCWVFLVLGSFTLLSGLLGAAGAVDGITEQDSLITIGAGIVQVGLFLRLLLAYTRADQSGVRSRALITRFVPADDVERITVSELPGSAYLPTVVTLYVHRRS